MQPSTAHSPQSAEDLDAVFVRFQAWSGSRKAKEETDGVRELSYEDALQSSRYRWQERALGNEATENIVAAPEPEPAAETTAHIEAAAQNPRKEISGDAAFTDQAFAADTVSLSSVGPEVRGVVPVKKESAWPPVFGASWPKRSRRRHTRSLTPPSPESGRQQVKRSARYPCRCASPPRSRRSSRRVRRKPESRPLPICASARLRWSSCERRCNTRSLSSSEIQHWHSPRAMLPCILRPRDFSRACDGASLVA